MSISENLLKAMKYAGLSGVELAVKSGVPTSRISEIITGKTKNPQMKTLVKLADAMKVDVVDLMGGEFHKGRTLEQIIDELPADPEYKMGMKEILKKTPEEIFAWLAEERRKERERLKRRDYNSEAWGRQFKSAIARQKSRGYGSFRSP